jgi:hypothetical protein
MYFWMTNRSRIVSCTPHVSLWGLLGIHIWHPGVLCGRGCKVEVCVEWQERGNIEIRTTIFVFLCLFGRQIDLEWSHVHPRCPCGVYWVSIYNIQMSRLVAGAKRGKVLRNWSPEILKRQLQLLFLHIFRWQIQKEWSRVWCILKVSLWCSLVSIWNIYLSWLILRGGGGLCWLTKAGKYWTQIDNSWHVFLDDKLI